MSSGVPGPGPRLRRVAGAVIPRASRRAAGLACGCGCGDHGPCPYCDREAEIVTGNVLRVLGIAGRARLREGGPR